MPVLEWRQTARADLLAIIGYIADDNPNAAQELKDELVLTCKSKHYKIRMILRRRRRRELAENHAFQPAILQK